MKNYVADELANKVYHLTVALKQANEIIEKLDEQNENLKQILSNLGIETEENNHQEFYLV
jgi:DNA-binding TFAR19-related protein (PDSD5 family)